MTTETFFEIVFLPMIHGLLWACVGGACMVLLLKTIDLLITTFEPRTAAPSRRPERLARTRTTYPAYRPIPWNRRHTWNVG